MVQEAFLCDTFEVNETKGDLLVEIEYNIDKYVFFCV